MLRLLQRLSLVAAGLTAGLLAVACGGLRVGSPTSVGSPTPASNLQGKASFVLSSKEFAQEGDANPQAAVDKYKNKVVEVTGKLMGIGYDLESKPQFLLDGPNGHWCCCQMTDKYPWTKANSGQVVVLKGKGHPAMHRTLVDCEIVKVTGDPAPPGMTADEFAKRAENFKPDGKTQFVVSGEILNADNINFYLKCQDNKKGVHLSFAAMIHPPFNVASWKPGQKIEVIGTDSTAPGTPWLINCLPMDEPK